MSELPKYFSDLSDDSSIKKLNNFVNREEQIRQFCDLINAPVSLANVVYVNGASGSGKSLLLKRLRKYYLKKVSQDDWLGLASLDDKRFAETMFSLDQAVKPRSAWVDFKNPNSNMKDPITAMLSIRRQLSDGDSHFVLPVFDFAMAVFLVRSGKQASYDLSQNFSGDALELVAEVISAATGNAWIGLAAKALKITTKALGESKGVTRPKDFDKDIFDFILQMDVETELQDCLPDLFTSDFEKIQKHLPASEFCRPIVLMFDNHVTSSHDVGLHQGWVDRLIASLPPLCRTVAMLSGDFSESLSLQRVGLNGQVAFGYWSLQKINAENARLYFANRGAIPESKIDSALLQFATLDKGLQPFDMSLLGDTLANSPNFAHAQTSEVSDSAPYVSRRLVLEGFFDSISNDLKKVIFAIAATRTFNKEIFQGLTRLLDLGEETTLFNKVIGFSFVSTDDGENFRVHSLFQSLIREWHPSEFNQSLNFLVKFLSDRSELSYSVDRLYYLAKLDPRKESRSVAAALDNAIYEDNIEFCELLNSLIPEIEFPQGEPLAVVLLSQAKYKLNYRHSEEARRYLEEALRTSVTSGAIVSNDIMAEIFRNIGDLEVLRGNFDKARTAYISSVALHEKSDSLSVLQICSWAMSVCGIGDIYYSLSDFISATEYYQQSINMLEKELEKRPEKSELLSANLVNSYAGLAATQQGLGHYEESHSLYEKGLKLADIELAKSAQNPTILINKATNLLHLGALEFENGQSDSALNNFLDSTKIFSKLLENNSKNTLALANYGVSCQKIAELFFIDRGALNEAREWIVKAIEYYSAGLLIAPGDVNLLFQRAVNYRLCANIEFKANELNACLAASQKAENDMSAALKLSSKNVHVKRDLAGILLVQAECYLKLHSDELAQNICLKVRDILDECLKLTPNDVSLSMQQALLERTSGTIHMNRGEKDEAEEYFLKSLAVLGEAIERLPKYPQARQNRMSTLSELFEIISDSGRRSKLAEIALDDADALRDMGHSRPAVEISNANLLRKIARRSLGDSDTTNASVLFDKAEVIYNKVIELTPVYADGPIFKAALMVEKARLTVQTNSDDCIDLIRVGLETLALLDETEIARGIFWFNRGQLQLTKGLALTLANQPPMVILSVLDLSIADFDRSIAMQFDIVSSVRERQGAIQLRKRIVNRNRN